MTVLTHDISIRQGEDWSFSFTHYDENGDAVALDTYSAALMVRKKFGTALRTYFSSEAVDKDGTVTLTSEGLVTISQTALQADGILSSLFIEDALSAEASERFNVYQYNLELTSASGVVTRALQGHFIVERRVEPQ